MAVEILEVLKEIEAQKSIVDALDGLEPVAISRVLRWACEAYDIWNVKEQTSG